MHANDPVNRYMTAAVLSIDVDAEAGEILRLFAEYPVRHLPVVQGRKVVGMLSSADVLKLRAFLPKGADNAEFLSRRVKIEQLMRQPAMTVGPQSTVEDAAMLMATHGVHALPVVNSQDHLIGIVTTSDIIAAALGAEHGASSHADASAEPAVRLTPGQMDHATRLAHAMLTNDDDSGDVARALVFALQRLKALETVCQSAERYVRAGQDERLHTHLLKAIEAARSPDTTGPALGL
jgi:CBS domain-containing membrane protein